MIKMEKLKIIVILFLFFSMLVLIADIWEIKIYKDYSIDLSNDINKYNLISPFQIRVNFSVDKKTEFYYDKNDLFMRNSKKICNMILNYNEINKISAVEYSKKSNLKSLEFEFFSPINVEYFVAFLTFQEKKVKKDFEYIKEIKILNEKNNILYLFDGKNYFELKTDEIIDVSKEIDLLKSEKYSEYQYFQKRFLINNNKNKNVYIPKDDIQDVFQYKIVPSLKKSDDFSLKNFEIKKIATNIFGAQINFVKSAYDTDSSLVLMYGYGNKILKFKRDSIIEFINNKESLRKNKDFILNEVKSVINILHLLENNNKKNLKILKIEQNNDENDNRITNIYFYEIVDGLPVIYSNLEDYNRMKLLNSEINYVKYNNVNYDYKYKYFDIIGNSNRNDQVFKILNDINNFEIFKNDFKIYNDLETVTEFDILSEIDDFYLIYFENKEYLKPYFVLVINNISYIIDFNTLKILKFFVN